MRERSPGKTASKSTKAAGDQAREPGSPAAQDDAYLLLFENHPQPVFVFDAETFRILAVNRAATDDYGYSRDEFLSMTVRDIRPPEDVALFVRIASAPLGEGERRFGLVSRHRKKDGSVILVEIAVREVTLQGRRARLSVAYDVTAREAANAALRNSESLKSSMLEAVQDAIVAADIDGRIVEFNAAAERLFGYSKAEVLGRDLAETIIPPYMRARHRRAVANYLETGERHMIGRTAEMVALRADASEVPVEISLSAICVDGQHAFTASIRDLTAQKFAESEAAIGYGVARTMIEASSVREAACGALQAVCETLGWDVGGVWVLDPEAQVLRLVDMWHLPNVHVAPFEEESFRRVFARGLSLPGRVWAHNGPIWIPDISAEHSCPRFEAARASGLRSAFAFPIPVDGEFVGVVEFFGSEMREPNERRLELFGVLGSRLGLFIQRWREEERHRVTSRTLQAVLTASPLAVILVRGELTVEYWSPASERLFGWTEKEMVGLPYTMLVPEEQRAEFRKHFDAVLGGGQIVGVETERLRKDGARVRVSLSGAPVIDAGGEVTGAVIIATDLSLRKPV